MRKRSILVVATALAGIYACSNDTFSNGAVDDAAAGADATTDAGTSDAIADALPCGAAVLTSDPKNCGVCGHDCLGGACVASACLPVVIADHQPDPEAIAVDATSIYWTLYGSADAGTAITHDDGALMKIGKDGSGKVQLAHSPFASRLAIGDSIVYWTSVGGQSVDAIDHNGASQRPIANEPGPPTNVIADVDAGRMYWLVRDTTVMTVRSSPLLISLPTTFESDQVGESATGFAMDDTHIYFSTFYDVAPPTRIASVPRGGCPDGGNCSTTVLLTSSRSIAVDGTNIYIAEENGGATRVDKAGANRIILADAASTHFVVLDGPWLYYATTGGVVGRVKKDGSAAAIPIAIGQADPGWIAFDANAVYWTNAGTYTPGPEQHDARDGQVMKIAKSW